MKGGARVALAIAIGYCLGRRHKLRTAAMLAVAGAVRGLRSGGKGGGGLLEQGVKALGSSPELERITGRIREDLVEVGKAAAVAATSRQIDSLSGKLHERAEALRKPEAAGRAAEAAGRATEAAGRGTEAAGRGTEEEEYEDERSETREGPGPGVARTRG